MASGRDLWNRYLKYYLADTEIGLSLDISRMRFEDSYLDEMAPAVSRAFEAMDALEGGAIANQDEERMVGHYWLRAPDLAPTPELTSTIRETLDAIRTFVRKVHEGKLKGQKGPFRNLIHIGIGGSALGPQFISQALGGAGRGLSVHFLDNTDPDGFDAVLRPLESELGQTLVTVVSKSGGTPETRNGMVETRKAYERAGLDFAAHAVAVTGIGSKLDKVAVEEGWLERFPMWDWVGGRTSVGCAVGLLPAALEGIDIDAFLEGMAAMDRWTRGKDLRRNPAALLALMWYKSGNGHGEKDMVLLPYKDRLLLFSRYLQQLIMESLGKELDRDGKPVHQGIAVYGNKGSTDQHAYVQQLRDGVHNFFVTFIQVLRDRKKDPVPVEGEATSGDFLLGFLQGTRRALFEKGRDSITITLDDVTPFAVGALIALYDRTVGLYAELVNINAYHQPGVEAGKKAAASVLDLQAMVVKHLESKDRAFTACEVADAVGQPGEVEAVYKILEHLAANPGGGVAPAQPGAPDKATFKAS